VTLVAYPADLALGSINDLLDRISPNAGTEIDPCEDIRISAQADEDDRRLDPREGLARDALIQLAATMAQRGITRSDLARRGGWSTTYISRVMTGRVGCSLHQAARLARAIGIEWSVPA
jgi:antitoxin component HigA of HigAB toxin-antitoxin module